MPLFACWARLKRSLGPLPAAIFVIHLTVTSPWSYWHTVCQTSARSSSWAWQHQCLLCQLNIMPRERKCGIWCQLAREKIYAKHVYLCLLYLRGIHNLASSDYILHHRKMCSHWSCLEWFFIQNLCRYKKNSKSQCNKGRKEHGDRTR